MLYLLQYKNEQENFIRLHTGEVIWNAAFNPVRIWHPDGEELLCLSAPKKPWWKCYKGIFEFEVTLNTGKEPENYRFVAKGWFNGHWQIHSATQTFDLFRHTGHLRICIATEKKSVSLIWMKTIGSPDGYTGSHSGKNATLCC